MMDRERSVGVSWWGAIEYWGESNRWPKKGWNFSFFSHTLEPRPQAYLIKSGIVPDEPLTRIGVIADNGERLIWNDIHSGQYLLDENWNPNGKDTRGVFVFSNARTVELFLNGRSLGVQTTDANVAHWKSVAYEAGRLEARGANGSVHAIETTGPAIALKMVEELPGQWRADVPDLKYVRIYAVDSRGRRVPDATNKLKVTVEGLAELYALDDGDHYTDLLFNVNEKAMKNGFLMAILKSCGQSGKVKLKVQGDGMDFLHIMECTK
jgi:beta-galactosidase